MTEERELNVERTEVLNQDLVTMTTKLNNLKKEIVSLTEEKLKLNTTIKDNAVSISASKDQIDEMKKLIVNLKTERSKLEYNLEQNVVTVERLSTQNSNLTTELDNLMIEKQSKFVNSVFTINELIAATTNEYSLLFHH